VLKSPEVKIKGDQAWTNEVGREENEGNAGKMVLNHRFALGKEGEGCTERNPEKPHRWSGGQMEPRTEEKEKRSPSEAQKTAMQIGT